MSDSVKQLKDEPEMHDMCRACNKALIDLVEKMIVIMLEKGASQSVAVMAAGNGCASALLYAFVLQARGTYGLEWNSEDFFNDLHSVIEKHSKLLAHMAEARDKCKS